MILDKNIKYIKYHSLYILIYISLHQSSSIVESDSLTPYDFVNFFHFLMFSSHGNKQMVMLL